MRILQIINSLKIGGAEKLIADIVPLLRDKGHTVDVCLFDGIDTDFKSLLQQAGIHIIEFGYNCNVYNPIFAFKLARIMKEYDIVHTHNTAPQFFATLGSYFSHSKLITTEHSTSTRRRHFPVFKYIDKWMYGRYDKIICISEPSELSLKSYIGKKFPIVTIQNGVNTQIFFDAQPVDLGYEDSIKITMVAGFRYEKDQPTLIKSLKYLPDNYHLFLVGDGVERKHIEALIQSEGMDKRVHLLGIRGDISGILKSSDIIVMSSHREGLSLSSVEGMCSGHPFLASDVEGLREVVQDYGLLFPHGDSKSFAKTVLQVINNPVYASEVAARCMERGRQYDISKMVDAYNNVYLNLVNENNSRK